MKEIINKKSKALKAAIERYNTLKRFVDKYKSDKSLDEFVNYVRLTTAHASDNVVAYYESMIKLYENNNDEQLLSNLYDKFLNADETRRKLADELKDCLRNL